MESPKIYSTSWVINHKIRAIKNLREFVSRCGGYCGIVQAKDFFDELHKYEHHVHTYDEFLSTHLYCGICGRAKNG
jgi:ribosomal protein L7/L12